MPGLAPVSGLAVASEPGPLLTVLDYGFAPGTSEVAEGVVLDDNLRVLQSLPDGLCRPGVRRSSRSVPARSAASVPSAPAPATGRDRVRRPPLSFEVVSSYRYVDDMALEEYLGFPVRPAGGNPPRARPRVPVPSPRLSRRPLRSLLLDEIFGPERSSTRSSGPTTTAAGPGPLAPQARQHPLVRQIVHLDLQPGRHRPHPLHGPRPGGAGKGGRRQAPDRYLVDDDRAHQRPERTGLPDSEARETPGARGTPPPATRGTW